MARRHELTIASRDHESLLITFLGELMVRSRHEARLFNQIFIRAITQQRLQATVVGAEVANWRLSPFPRDPPEVHLQADGVGLMALVRIYRGLSRSP